MSTIPPIGAVPDVATATAIASNWGNATGSSSKGRVVHRFNTPTERDSAITAPAAGMVCYVLSTNQFYGYRTTSGWGPLSPTAAVHCEVYQAAAQAMPNTTLAKVAFDTVEAGTSAGWDNTNRWFLCPSAGRYLVTATVMVASGAGVVTLLFASVFKNGAEVKRGNALGGGPGVQNASANLAAVVTVAAGDNLAIWGLVGPALNTFPGPAYTFAAFSYLGP